METNKNSVSITDAAKLIGTSRTTIHKWINTAQIERFYIMKQPRIRMSEIERVLKELNK